MHRMPKMVPLNTLGHSHGNHILTVTNETEHAKTPSNITVMFKCILQKMKEEGKCSTYWLVTENEGTQIKKEGWFGRLEVSN